MHALEFDDDDAKSKRVYSPTVSSTLRSVWTVEMLIERLWLRCRWSCRGRGRNLSKRTHETLISNNIESGFARHEYDDLRAPPEGFSAALKHKPTSSLLLGRCVGYDTACWGRRAARTLPGGLRRPCWRFAFEGTFSVMSVRVAEILSDRLTLF